jgi:hypothetical protein
VLVLSGDGPFTSDRYDVVRIEGGAPRVLIRVFGAGEPFASPRIEVGTPEVLQVRVGAHAQGGRQDLHFVADLAAEAVRLVAVEPRGNTLRVRFAR